MRVVLDTNVVALVLLWGGTPERLIELAGDDMRTVMPMFAAASTSRSRVTTSSSVLIRQVKKRMA